MGTLRVGLSDRSYDIRICRGFESLESLIKPLTTSPQIMIVSNELVAPLYLESVSEQLAEFELATCKIGRAHV